MCVPIEPDDVGRLRNAPTTQPPRLKIFPRPDDAESDHSNQTDGISSQEAAREQLRARLLRMILQNERARKPKEHPNQS